MSSLTSTLLESTLQAVEKVSCGVFSFLSFLFLCLRLRAFICHTCVCIPTYVSAGVVEPETQMAPRWRQITKQPKAKTKHSPSLLLVFPLNSLLKFSSSSLPLRFLFVISFLLSVPVSVSTSSPELALSHSEPPTLSIPFFPLWLLPSFPTHCSLHCFHGMGAGVTSALLTHTRAQTHAHTGTTSFPPWIPANSTPLTGSIQPALTVNGPCN